MKRLITIALAIVMIFALGVTVFADSSPVPKEQYSIVVTYSPSDGSLGDASADKNTVIIDPSDDGLVTLTANVKDGKFSKWDIKGEYDIVEGSLTTPKLVIRPHSDIIANAIFEKDGKPATPDTPSSSLKLRQRFFDRCFCFARTVVIRLIFAESKLRRKDFFDDP